MTFKQKHIDKMNDITTAHTEAARMDVRNCTEYSYTAAHWLRVANATSDKKVAKQCKHVKRWLSMWESVRPSGKQRKHAMVDYVNELTDLELTAEALHTWYKCSLEGRMLTPPDSMRLIFTGLESHDRTRAKFDQATRDLVLKLFKYDSLTGAITRNEPQPEWFEGLPTRDGKSAASYSRSLAAFKRDCVVSPHTRAISAASVTLSTVQLAFMLAFGDEYGYCQRINYTKAFTTPDLSAQKLTPPLVFHTMVALSPKAQGVSYDYLYGMRGKSIVTYKPTFMSPEAMQFWEQYKDTIADGKLKRAVQAVQRTYWQAIDGREWRINSEGVTDSAQRIILNRAIDYYEHQVNNFEKDANNS